MSATNPTTGPWAFPKQTLNDSRLRLVPLELADLDRLARALLEPGTWFYDHRGIRTRADLLRRLERDLAARAEGARHPWVVEIPGEALPVGMSALIAPSRELRAVEIGGTWIAKRWHRTFVNTALKKLMLGHCFEALGCARVSFKVDAQNANSQRAVTRIGARFEGVMRHGWVLGDGSDRRDLHLYSVLEAEWPGVRGRLEARLAAEAARPTTGAAGPEARP